MEERIKQYVNDMEIWKPLIGVILLGALIGITQWDSYTTSSWLMCLITFFVGVWQFFKNDNPIGKSFMIYSLSWAVSGVILIVWLYINSNSYSKLPPQTASMSLLMTLTVVIFPFWADFGFEYENRTFKFDGIAFLAFIGVFLGIFAISKVHGIFLYYILASLIPWFLIELFRKRDMIKENIPKMKDHPFKMQTALLKEPPRWMKICWAIICSVGSILIVGWFDHEFLEGTHWHTQNIVPYYSFYFLGSSAILSILTYFGGELLYLGITNQIVGDIQKQQQESAETEASVQLSDTLPEEAQALNPDAPPAEATVVLFRKKAVPSFFKWETWNDPTQLLVITSIIVASFWDLMWVWLLIPVSGVYYYVFRRADVNTKTETRNRKKYPQKVNSVLSIGLQFVSIVLIPFTIMHLAWKWFEGWFRYLLMVIAPIVAMFLVYIGISVIPGVYFEKTTLGELGVIAKSHPVSNAIFAPTTRAIEFLGKDIGNIKVLSWLPDPNRKIAVTPPTKNKTKKPVKRKQQQPAARRAVGKKAAPTKRPVARPLTRKTPKTATRPIQGDAQKANKALKLRYQCFVGTLAQYRNTPVDLSRGSNWTMEQAKRHAFSYKRALSESYQKYVIKGKKIGPSYEVTPYFLYNVKGKIFSIMIPEKMITSWNDVLAIRQNTNFKDPLATPVYGRMVRSKNRCKY